MKMYEDDNLIIGIDNSWSNDYRIGLDGWVVSKKGPLDKVEIQVGDSSVPITNWFERPDLRKQYSQFNVQNQCGFRVQIDRKAEHRIIFKAKNQVFAWEGGVRFTGQEPPSVEGFNDCINIFNEFVTYVNGNRLRVLEIGSRIVSPGSKSKREIFPQAASYVGFDYYTDSNTDVAGDAHRLSDYFKGAKFDAIFSLAVFEHLAMPWVVAIEIAKLLELGGVTFHWVPQSWPLHERPWDFWRFSEESLRVLFSPAAGFQTIKMGYAEPLRMHFDHAIPGQEGFPFSIGFGSLIIYAKKTSEVDLNKFKWEVSPKDLLGKTCVYPPPSSLLDGVDS